MAKAHSHYKMSKPAKRMLVGFCKTAAEKAAFKELTIKAELAYADYKKRPLKRDKTDDSE